METEAGQVKTEKEILDDITRITERIQAISPELSKYIDEMQIKDSDGTDPEVTRKNLEEYYESLEALLKKYTANHEHSI